MTQSDLGICQADCSAKNVNIGNEGEVWPFNYMYILLQQPTNVLHEDRYSCLVKSKCHFVLAFYSLARIFARRLDHSFPACAFFFFLVEINLCTLIPLFMPGSVA